MLFSVLFTVSLMFLLLMCCYSSAEQYISFPHVNSWLHSRSPSEDGRKQLPVNSEVDALRRCWSDMSLWILPPFLRPGGQHVVMVQTASSFLCMSCIPIFFSKHRFTVYCLMKEKSFKMILTHEKKETVMFMALAVFLLAFTSSTYYIYCCFLVDSWYWNSKVSK